TKKVSLNKSKSSLPSFQAPKPSANKTRNENYQTIRPPSRSKLFYAPGTNEAELERLTDEQISQLYKLTRQFKNSSRRGELWLRLAERYVEKARLIEY